MKKLLCLILFSAFFCLESVAQKVQNEQPLSNKTTMKGRRELRREMRTHRAMEGLAARNERKARKEHKLGTANHHDSKAKKIGKDRRKAKQRDEKDQLKKDKAAQIEKDGNDEPIAGSKG